MSYTRQGFADGQTLSAKHLIKIEDAIIALFAAIGGGTVDGDIPAYHYAEASRVAASIAEWKSNHTNSLVFGAISDIHVFANDEAKTENTQNSIKHAAFALEQVGISAGCDFVVNLGDNCWENGIDTDNAMQAQEYVCETIASAFSKLTSYRIPGNHDRSASTQKIYDLIGINNSFDAWGATQIRGFGYKDWADKKVRVIFLNSVDYMNVSGGYGMSYDQKDFLMRSLDLSGKKDAADWQILLLSHIPLDFTGGDYNTGSDIAAILAAYQNGETARIAVTSANAVNEDPTKYATYSGGELVYDYGGKNKAKIIANVHGHVHNTCVGTMDGSGILRMSAPNTCFYETYQSKYGYEVSAEEYAKLVKSEGSAKDTAAMFFCIDLSEKTVSTFGYGAGGIDKTKAYDGNIYTVTLNLTNASSSNKASSVVIGAAYSTTITANSGYELTGAKVTMGGTDVTTTAYANGSVNIASVTGDLVITATASEATSYKNLFSTLDSDYSVGRLNSSGGVNTSFTGGFVSGFIRVSYGDVIRAKSASSAFENSYGVIAYYDESKKYIEQVYTNDASSRLVMSADNKQFTTDTSKYASKFESMAFIRVMGYGSPDGFVITKNEPIE